ncbi:MAG: MFS transporter [Nanoarchaeota archaeon]
MSLLNNAISFKFFKNKELDQFYFAVFIMTFGESLINIFVPIYLFGLGFGIPKILFFYFLVSLYFLIFSYMGAKIVARIGEKHSILLSTPFIILYYIGLMCVDSNVLIFLFLPLLVSLRMMLYNYGYHLNFINHSKKTKRGHELAIFGIITLLATVFAPYLGSILANVNFTIVFIISSILITIGTAPLFLSKDKFEKIDFVPIKVFEKIFSKKNRGNFISFSGYAIESIIGKTIWPIFLIMLVGTINKTGLLISASMLFSLLMFHFVGRLTDKINKIKLLKIGTILYFFAWMGRIFADTAYKVLFIDSYKNLSEKILYLPWSAHNYDLAKKGNYFEFIVSREIIFNLIRVLVLPILIWIFWMNFHPFIMSFSIAGLFSMGYVFIDK